ncbi:LysR family transcriptional regulator [Sphingomonas oleivorans]|uniref:LysR family transcriptional regulator n=1 Tax=Sphingomonas oleivorans TaxID=1735121 RepID=A0A2T5G0P7_9SPHN|nr:LysR family transcriptional regulator [Sphingomonas oleivorans]PTQ12714.1 LysR family transcriptional regulator [Sphingomonas oleivorans]
MVDRLSGISIFVQAAEAGSFARAADRIGLSRSAVGKAIARLEERLGTRLFHRTTRGQSLTDDGQAFHERCLRVLAELEAAEAVLDDGGRSPSGMLRVSAPVLLGRRCVAPILLDLVRRHPQLELDLGFSDQLVDLVEERVDLAVRVGPLPDRAGLMARMLGTFRMVVCAAPAYLAERGAPLTPADLADHDCLPYAYRGGRVEPWRLTGPDGRLEEIQPRSRIRLNDLDAIAEAAMAGAGLACLPCWLVADRVRAGDLAILFGKYRATGSEVHAVWPQARHLPSRVRATIDELSTHMPALMVEPGKARGRAEMAGA